MGKEIKIIVKTHERPELIEDSTPEDQRVTAPLRMNDLHKEQPSLDEATREILAAPLLIGILSEFSGTGFEKAEFIKPEEVRGLVENLRRDYPDLESFEKQGNVDDFLNNILKRLLDEKQHKEWMTYLKYENAVQDFEQAVYGNHRSRNVSDEVKKLQMKENG